MAAERRRSFDTWKALPADVSSGCIDFSPAAPHDVRAVLKRAAAAIVPASAPSPAGAPSRADAALAPPSPASKLASPTPSTREVESARAIAVSSFAQGAGGSLESMGLRALSRRATSNSAIAAAALGMPLQLSSGERTSDKGARSEKEVAADVARCATVRAAAARRFDPMRSTHRSHREPPGAERLLEGLDIPDAIFSSLVDPPVSTTFAAICSTKIRMAGVKRGCHKE